MTNNKKQKEKLPAILTRRGIILFILVGTAHMTAQFTGFFDYYEGITLSIYLLKMTILLSIGAFYIVLILRMLKRLKQFLKISRISNIKKEFEKENGTEID